MKLRIEYKAPKITVKTFCDVITADGTNSSAISMATDYLDSLKDKPDQSAKIREILIMK